MDPKSIVNTLLNLNYNVDEYSDVYHYKEYGKSISGLVYKHL